MKKWTMTLLLVSLTVLALRWGVADEAAEKPAKGKLAKDTAAAIELFKKTDAKMAKFFDESTGYVVFPSVVKGAVGIGGAHGEGEVFSKGKKVGTATLSQVTIGAQLGGQEYAEVIFFETKENLDAFARSEWTMSAQATAVAAADGASANAKYDQGILVFTVAKEGLMFEASVGGQKFKFTPLKDVPLY